MKRVISTIFHSFILMFICCAALARDVLVENRTDAAYIVVTELYTFGVTSECKDCPVILGPHEKARWVIRLPSMTDYYYMLQVQVANSFDDIDNAVTIAKPHAQRHDESWFEMPSAYHVHDDSSLYDENSGYTKETEPFVVVVNDKTGAV
ncbi:MAG: hypothetical protein KDH94_06515 [Coxiellaceae bacterium]|nr:hypothetical protein [Coxiellaceae bacterium]